MQLSGFIQLILLVLILMTTSSCKQKALQESDYSEPAAFSLLGDPLYAVPPPDNILRQLEEKEASYRAEPDNPENIIWYGRFLAYAGRYRDAISIFSEGIEKFPEDARFYRHRGHRYITIRSFADAVKDLEKASILIEGRENQIEPDGLPNARGVPVSTLHGNIWYHLGLTYYLQGDYTRAFSAFINCLRSGDNDDNLVSATHWIYTTSCRINRQNDLERVLNRIEMNMDILENFSYHQLCLLYKGNLTVEETRSGIGEGPARDAVDYGIARWYACQDQEDKCQELLEEILTREGWASFGYIAAEADIYSKK